MEKEITLTILERIRINLPGSLRRVGVHPFLELRNDSLPAGQPLGIAPLSGEWRPPKAEDYIIQNAHAIPVSQAEAPFANLLRSPFAGTLLAGKAGEPGIKCFSPASSQPVITVEIQVDVLVEGFLAGNLALGK